MNERIRELAREAGLLVHNPEGVPTKLEKFSELILKECLDVALYGDEFEQARTNIKTLFGVEE